MRKSYVQIDGVLYDKANLPEHITACRAPMVMTDHSEFTSPIDGSHLQGRVALREHCERHGIVPMQDVKGLPAQKPVSYGSRQARVEDIKRAIYQLGN